MITGFLFWGKLIKVNGKPNWMNLYAGRVFRIGPLYWCAIAWMLALVAVKSHFQLHVSMNRLLSEVAQWMAMGFYWPHDVNGFAGTNQLLAGVTWSLQFEWFFYVSLLVTGFALSKRFSDLALAAGGLLAVTVYLLILPPGSSVMPVLVGVDLFLIGMTCASLQKRKWAMPLADGIAPTVAVVSVAGLVLFYGNGNLAGRCLLLGLVFFLIVSGCSLFGLLTTKSARRLGDISYGIYLLQGLVLSCLAAIPAVRRFSLSSPYAHWTTIAGAGLCLIGVATLAHVLIERPGVVVGKFVVRLAAMEARTPR